MSATAQPARDRAAINRENARHSTGPRTAAGKQRASLNAVRHGLTSRTIAGLQYELAQYRDFTSRFFDDLQPQGSLEIQLVHILAGSAWRLNRARAYALHLTSTEARAATSAEVYRDHVCRITAVSVHEQPYVRAFDRAWKQLTALQTARRCQEQQKVQEKAPNRPENQQERPQNQAENVAKPAPTNPATPLNATKAGFVFEKNKTAAPSPSPHRCRTAPSRSSGLARASPRILSIRKLRQ